MFKDIITATFALMLGASLALAQDDSAGGSLDDASDVNTVATGQTLEPDDADRDSAGGVEGGQFVAFGKSPLAYGTVLSNGTKYKGSTNWSSTYNNTYKRYEITINGNSYYYLNYATVITPAGDNRFCRSSSVGGKLLVYCADHTGATQPARFGFLTFKP
ncbi:MAG: hypothetical protein AAFP16_10555 [Pseudomonadota bacterium]